jgi:hypothetical protein
MMVRSINPVKEMRMRSNEVRAETSILRVVGLLLIFGLLLSAAARPTIGTAATRRSGPLVAVKAARATRGSVVVRLRAGASLRRDAVRLNGHRVGAITPHRKGERAILVLDRADHLRFGRNVITVDARSRAGSKATVRRLVVVRRDAPLPGIRQPRRVVTGQVARLDARRTRSAHGGRLHFHWRVVRAPRGAKVVLRGARARRPSLIADVPGDYGVALTVSEDPGVGGGAARPGAARASAASSACAVSGAAQTTVDQLPTYGPIASLPISRIPKGALQIVGGSVSPRSESEPAPSAEPGCATDVTDVAVEPDFAPIGAAIDTRAEVAGTEGIRIAGSFYPFPAGAESDGARFVLLDATNLELIRTENVDLSGSHRGVAAKMVEESGATGSVIVVSSCPFAACPGDAADSAEGFSAIETYFDGKLVAQVENQGQTLVPNSEQHLHGELEGWLHRGLPRLASEQPLFSYVAPEQIPFDTAAAATANSNTITVGGIGYPASLPPNSSAGFEVLVLNSAREPVAGTPVAFGTYSATNQSYAQSQEEAMATLLGNTDPSDTVFVESIGNPVPTTAAADRLAAAMSAIGADEWTFLGLQGSGAYAFVGNGSLPAGKRPETATAETSEEEVIAGGGPAGAGSLRGLLTRNEGSGLSPTIATATGAPDLEIAQVAYQPSTEWPQTETQGKVEATTYLAEALHLEGQADGEGLCYRPSRPDFRSIYCDQSLSPTATATKVEDASYPQGQSVSFSEAEFAEVKKELVSELADVEDVRAMFKTLKGPFLGERPEIGAQGVAGAIIGAMPEATRGNGADANTATLFASFLDAGSLLPGGDVLGVISAALYISEEFSEEEDEPSPPVWKFQVRADEVGERVEANLQTTVAHLGALEDILVSDWGKLSTSANEAGAGWAVSNAGLLRQSQTIELGFKRWMWESILPAGFELFHFAGVAPGEQGIIRCLTRRNSVWAPFEGAAAQSVFFPIDRFENGEPGYDGAFGMLAGPVSSASSVPVGTGLAEKIFGPPSKKGAGLTEAELFRDAPWSINEPRLIGKEGENENIQPGMCELRGP